MGRDRAGKMPQAVEGLQKRIMEWRETRTKRGAMPESLWSEAARLGRRYGVSSVSRNLGLDYHGLKRRAQGTKNGDNAELPSVSGFVELNDVASCSGFPGSSFEGSEFVTEMEIVKPGGVTVRIRQSGSEGMDMVGLAKSCLVSREV